MTIDYTEIAGNSGIPDAELDTKREKLAQSIPVVPDNLVRSVLDASVDAMALVEVTPSGGDPIVLAQNGAMADLRYRTTFGWEVRQLQERKQTLERLVDVEVRTSFQQLCEDSSGSLLTLTCIYSQLHGDPTRTRFLLTVRDDTDRRSIDNDVQEITSVAHCLVWKATVTEIDSGFVWAANVLNEAAVQRWLPVDRTEGVPFFFDWVETRNKADLEYGNNLYIQAIRNGDSGYSQTYRCHANTGNVLWLREDVRIQPLGGGRWFLAGVCTDVTESHNAAENLKALLTSARCLIWHGYVRKIDGYFDWNLSVTHEEAAQRWFPLHRSLGQSYIDAWLEAIPEEELKNVEARACHAMESGARGYSQQYRLGRDHERWISEDVRIEQDGNNAWRLVGVCTDITDQKRLEADREQMLAEAIDRADHDPLTGLLNHRAFHTRLAITDGSAHASGASYAIVVMDLDNFKFFNTAYGHTAGDEVLRRVSKAVQGASGSNYLIARLGGDEFAVILPDATSTDADVFVQKLEIAMESAGYQPPDHEWEVPITISAGVAAFPEDADGHRDVLALADERLKTAKYGVSDSAQIVAQLQSGLSSAFENFSMLNALVSAVDNKDRYTRRHSEDVLKYSLQIAQELGLDDETLFQVKIAALLHDVGKIGIPDEILRKPGKLTDDEFAAIKQHPVMGAIMVNAVPGFEYTLDAVRFHHERWDGQGYPSGLAGEQIPLLGRLMAVADAYSAMTTDRPYRKSMGTTRADEILRGGAGTQWDPECVDAFLRARRG